MTNWKPDTTFHEKSNEVYNGILYVVEALRDFNIGESKKIVTSREPGMK